MEKYITNERREKSRGYIHQEVSSDYLWEWGIIDAFHIETFSYFPLSILFLFSFFFSSKFEVCIVLVIIKKWSMIFKFENYQIF